MSRRPSVLSGSIVGTGRPAGATGAPEPIDSAPAARSSAGACAGAVVASYSVGAASSEDLAQPATIASARIALIERDMRVEVGEVLANDNGPFARFALALTMPWKEVPSGTRGRPFDCARK